MAEPEAVARDGEPESESGEESLGRRQRVANTSAALVPPRRRRPPPPSSLKSAQPPPLLMRYPLWLGRGGGLCWRSSAAGVARGCYPPFHHMFRAARLTVGRAVASLAVAEGRLRPDFVRK